MHACLVLSRSLSAIVAPPVIYICAARHCGLIGARWAVCGISVTCLCCVLCAVCCVLHAVSVCCICVLCPCAVSVYSTLRADRCALGGVLRPIFLFFFNLGLQVQEMRRYSWGCRKLMCEMKQNPYGCFPLQDGILVSEHSSPIELAGRHVLQMIELISLNSCDTTWTVGPCMPHPPCMTHAVLSGVPSDTCGVLYATKLPGLIGR